MRSYFWPFTGVLREIWRALRGKLRRRSNYADADESLTDVKPDAVEPAVSAALRQDRDPGGHACHLYQ